MRRQAEVEQDLRADSVIPKIGLEPELLVRFDGIRAGVLKLVRLELVEQTDAATFLIEIHDHAPALFGDHLHRGVQLPAAVASQRMEHVASEALRVHSDENAVVAFAHVAENERDVLVIVDVVAISDHPPYAELGREPRFGNAMNESLGLEAIRDELRDGDEREVVLRRELLELRTPRSRAIFIQNFANDSGRIESSEVSQDRLRLQCGQHAEELHHRAREAGNVSGSSQIGGTVAGSTATLNRLCAILRADSRGHAEACGGIDAHRECRALLLSVLLALLRKLELVGALAREGEADQPPPS